MLMFAKFELKSFWVPNIPRKNFQGWVFYNALLQDWFYLFFPGEQRDASETVILSETWSSGMPIEERRRRGQWGSGDYKASLRCHSHANTIQIENWGSGSCDGAGGRAWSLSPPVHDAAPQEIHGIISRISTHPNSNVQRLPKSLPAGSTLATGFLVQSQANCINPPSDGTDFPCTTTI